MQEFEIEYAKFIKVKVKADSLESARALSYTFDDEDIKKNAIRTDGYVLWEEARAV